MVLSQKTFKAVKIFRIEKHLIKVLKDSFLKSGRDMEDIGNDM